MTPPRRRASDKEGGESVSHADIARDLALVASQVGKVPDPIARTEGSGIAGMMVSMQIKLDALTEAHAAEKRAREAERDLAAAQAAEAKREAENSPARRIAWQAIGVAVALIVGAAGAWVAGLHH